jgi:hypothetical protein
MPLLEETKYIPTDKYAQADELRDHAVRIGRHYNLYTRALFQTEVLGLRWDDSKGLWSVETNHNDSIRARFVIPVAGPLHKPKLPGISGIKFFEGHSFHSSCWDYDYTGGRTVHPVDSRSSQGSASALSEQEQRQSRLFPILGNGRKRYLCSSAHPLQLTSAIMRRPTGRGRKR